LWVKAHVGIVGNELANQPAKAAASNGDVTSFQQTPDEYTDKHDRTKKKWKKEWEECTKAVITKEFFPKVKDRQKLK
jgi:hypothetical protein